MITKDLSLSASFVLALAMLLVWLPAPSFAKDPVCVEGPSHPVNTGLRNAAPLRPQRTAVCPYDFDEMVDRLTKLSIDKHSPDTVENVEEAFGMPQMTTSYDDPRIADYTTILSGQGGWKLLVWVREAFFPLNKGPDEFVPGLRPKRLSSVDNAKLIVNLNVLGPNGADSANCVQVSLLFDALVKAGWKDIEMEGPGPTDGGRRTPYFQHGRKTVGLGAVRGQCAANIYLGQAPRK